jgi:hypothetical protein
MNRTISYLMFNVSDKSNAEISHLIYKKFNNEI